MFVRLLARQGDMRVVGEAVGGPEAGRLAAARQPDVLLLDVGRPLAAGLEGLRRLRKKSPRTKVLLLAGGPRGLRRAGEPGEGLGGEARGAGAKGSLPRRATHDEILTATRLVSSGSIW